MPPHPTLHLEACTVDLAAAQVERDGERTPLTRLEAALLAFLAGRAGHPATRDELLVEVWGYRPGVKSQTIENTVWRVRQKIERDPRRPKHLKSRYGTGYALELPGPKPSNIADADPLFGRDDAVAALDRLRGARVVTLLGPAGVGKTRIARRYAADRGGWFVDVAAASTKEGLVEAVAAGLGVAGPDLFARVADALAGRELLVLDNLEQVVAGAREALPEWLAGAPGLRILATSREVLRIAGEVVHEVPPLADDAAVALLTERVRATGAVWAADAELLGAIVDRLDRMPLAIELAAARAPVMPAAELLARLDDRFRVLGRGPHGRTPRQETLRGAIGWSWDLLAPDERAGLARVTVFVAPFEVAAGEAIVGGAGALDVLASLRDKSLLAARPDGKLVLYESIREFAAEHLEGDERDSTWARHAEWFVAHPDRPEELVAAATRLAERRPDLAEQAIVALDPHVRRRGAPAALHPAIDRLAARGSADVLRVRGNLRRVAGLPDEGDLARALAAYEATGDRLGAASTRSSLAAMAADAGRWAEAREQAAQAVSEASGDARVERACRIISGNLAWQSGALEDAVAAYRDALAIPSADAFEEAVLLGNLGLLAVERGRHGDAEPLLTRALAAARAAGSRRPEAKILATLGILFLDVARLDEAEACLEEAFEIHGGVGDRRQQALNLRQLGCVSLDRGDASEAVERFEAALALHRRGGSAFDVAADLLSLGIARYARGEVSPAAGCWLEALERIVGREPRLEAYLQAWLAGVSDAGERLAAAREAASRSGIAAAALVVEARAARLGERARVEIAAIERAAKTDLTVRWAWRFAP